MNRLRVRILHHASLSPAMVDAALSGARRFKPYGVEAETGTLNGRLSDVRSGRVFRSFLRSPATFRKEDFMPGMAEMFFPRNVIGLGLVESLACGSAGQALRGRGAVVALGKVRTVSEDIAPAALAAVVSHELGHVFGAAHCADNCVMNDGLFERARETVKNIDGFCRDCSGAVSRFINESLTGYF